MKTVQIDHPHAEVIAAYYSGKTVQVRGFGDEWHDWQMLSEDSEVPSFFSKNEWRIKPEPLVKWVEVDEDDCATGEIWTNPPPPDYIRDGCRIVRMVEQPE